MVYLKDFSMHKYLYCWTYNC